MPVKGLAIFAQYFVYHQLNKSFFGNGQDRVRVEEAWKYYSSLLETKIEVLSFL